VELIHKTTRNNVIWFQVYQRGGIKEISHFLKDLSSFLSKSTGICKSTQQWGMNPLEEELVKVRTIIYNEG